MQGGGKVHAKDRDARIVIVGGGAAGLCTAWYLKQAGFTRVQVLEKSPRLGGKCRSLTVHGQSFDLGANYITSAYKRVRELAKHVDADMYVEKQGHVIDLRTGQIRSILREVLKDTSFFSLASQSIRYLFKRWRISRLLSPHAPGFAHVHNHPEIQGSFEDWLKRNDFEALIPMFEIPLTLMGYGKLKDIAAAYALTYMSLGTFKDLGMFAANLPLRCWPRRFTYGYERLFERLAAEVDVLTGVDITDIKRDAYGVTVSYRLLEQQLEGKTTDDHVARYDYLILACPQLTKVFEKDSGRSRKKKYWLDLRDEELRLFNQVRINPFYVATYFAAGTEKVSAVTFSLPKPEQGQPYVVTRQYPENDFISIYSRDDWENPIGREAILANNRRFLEEIGAKSPDAEPFSVDDWAYFPHVTPAAVDSGFYSDLDALQGEHRTFYCGGLLGFELVESIAEQAHHLVQQHFPVHKQEKKDQPSVAVIGAGPAGLSAAWYLKNRGYRYVRVFEKLNRVGGKCETLKDNGKYFDLAAHEMLGGYGDVMDIASALKVPSKGHQKVLVYNTKQRKYLGILQASRADGASTLSIMWASIRYTWMLLTRYRKFSQPGSGFADAPDDLLRPIDDWMKAHRLEALKETFIYVMKVQGYGSLNELPAAYLVKFQGLGNWISNVLHVVGLIQYWPRVFSEGFQSLWNAVAGTVDLRLEAKIHSVKRVEQPGMNKPRIDIKFEDGKVESFDKLIVTCPLDFKTLKALGLDMKDKERELFKKVRYVEFVTTAARAKGLPTGVVATIPVPPVMHYTGYIKIHEHSDISVFFSLADKEDFDPERISQNIEEQVAEAPTYQGVQPEVVGEFHPPKGWQYFPHVNQDDFKGGFYNHIEAIQGNHQTWYAGSLLGFETVGNTVAYTRRLIERDFPRL